MVGTRSASQPTRCSSTRSGVVHHFNSTVSHLRSFLSSFPHTTTGQDEEPPFVLFDPIFSDGAGLCNGRASNVAILRPLTPVRVYRLLRPPRPPRLATNIPHARRATHSPFAIAMHFATFVGGDYEALEPIVEILNRPNPRWRPVTSAADGQGSENWGVGEGVVFGRLMDGRHHRCWRARHGACWQDTCEPERPEPSGPSDMI